MTDDLNLPSLEQIREHTPHLAGQALPPGRIGRCYELAGRKLVRMAAQGDLHTHVRLHHGTIMAPDLRAAGFGGNPHAWIEARETSVRVAYEPITDRWYSLDEFEATFGPEHVKSYLMTEALNTMVGTGHYGPWEEQA